MLAQKLQAAGVQVEQRTFPGMTNEFSAWARWCNRHAA